MTASRVHIAVSVITGDLVCDRSYPTRRCGTAFRIRIANHAALAELSTPTVATGTPLGICTVANRTSCPPPSPPDNGTPITGRSVLAATAPARCAASPAPQIMTAYPASRASLANADTRAGSRCADITNVSNEIPASCKTTEAAVILLLSLAEPMRIATLP